MIRFAKSFDLGDCRPPEQPCATVAHVRRKLQRKLLLPAQRCQNEPFYIRVLPINRDEWAIESFEGLPPLQAADGWRGFEGLASELAEFEREAIFSQYPQSCLAIRYTTAVQFDHRIVALVFVGPRCYVRRQLRDATGDYFDSCLIATGKAVDGRAGCILLHANWGRQFIRGIQRDARKDLDKCLEQRRTRRRV